MDGVALTVMEHIRDAGHCVSGYGSRVDTTHDISTDQSEEMLTLWQIINVLCENTYLNNWCANILGKETREVLCILETWKWIRWLHRLEVKINTDILTPIVSKREREGVHWSIFSPSTHPCTLILQSHCIHWTSHHTYIFTHSQLSSPLIFIVEHISNVKKIQFN